VINVPRTLAALLVWTTSYGVCLYAVSSLLEILLSYSLGIALNYSPAGSIGDWQFHRIREHCDRYRHNEQFVSCFWPTSS